MLFCTNTDSLGNCKKDGDAFEWNGGKTTIELLVLNKDTITPAKLKFVLFDMKNAKEGTLYADLSLNVIPNSVFAVKKLYFYKPGYYKVDVLDDKDKFLTTGFITITDRKP